MHASDRDDFKLELAKLCAGFDVPLTKAREEGFFAGLAKMSLAQFRRCVEYALGEDYPEDKFPTVGRIWKIHKRSVPASSKGAIDEEPDHLAYYANRLLWMHISHRGGLGSTGRFVPGVKGSGMQDSRASSELERCVRFKREIVREYSGYIAAGDEDATPAMFLRWWLAGLRKVSEVLPRTARDLEQLAQAPESQQPFALWMARDLEPAQPELA